MKILLIVVAALLVIGGAVALFMNSNKDADTSSTTESTTTQQTTPTEQDTTDNEQPATGTEQTSVEQVDISNFAYSPKELTVKVGTTVKWTNKDSVAHTVTKSAGESDGPDSPSLGQGDSYEFKYTKAGTYEYFCTPHPQMTATVTVTE